MVLYFLNEATARKNTNNPRNKKILNTLIKLELYSGNKLGSRNQCNYWWWNFVVHITKLCNPVYLKNLKYPVFLGE